MVRQDTWQLLKISAMGLGVMGLSGCPAALLPFNSPPGVTPQAIPVSQTAITPATLVDRDPQPVSYDICGHQPDWQRPDLEVQRAELMANPRYGEALDEAPLRGLFEKFWNESIITFTTYGLSARTEPIFLSGVWTTIAAMDACYAGDRPEAINQGDMAEVWLFGHQVVAIEWTGDQYKILVESAPTGLQFVQFERLEDNPDLPIVVLEADGTAIAVTSGDW